MSPHLPPNETTLFRSLKKTAIVLLLLLRLDKPLGEVEIAAILDVHRETVRAYLQSLSRLGVVTRSQRYNGWILTAGGRQMILGQTALQSSAEGVGARLAGTGFDSPSSVAVPLSGKIKTKAENPSSMAKNPSSLPLAADSLSLSFKDEKQAAAAAMAGNSSSSAEIPPSRVHASRLLPAKLQLAARRRMAAGRGSTARPGVAATRKLDLVQANLEAFASIGLAPNNFVSEICQMGHVTPDYILGQKRRLEFERRYSHGLLLIVIRSNDHLPKKYLPREYMNPQIPGSQLEPEPEEEPDLTPKMESDPSVHEPLSENGMTAMKAWTAALRQLKTDMPKGTYDTWVKDTILLSARNGLFVIGTSSDDACNWLASRLTTTIKRLITGICDRSVEVMFANINGLTEQN